MHEMIDPILEEIYATREKIWKKCGETIEGLVAYYSQPIPGVKTMKLPVRRPTAPASKPSRATTRVRPSRTSSRKKAVRP